MIIMVGEPQIGLNDKLKLYGVDPSAQQQKNITAKSFSFCSASRYGKNVLSCSEKLLLELVLGALVEGRKRGRGVR
jgi:hypothetical protein